jgi:hypothetical protein
MSVEVLPDFALDAERPLGARFAALDIRNYRSAARHVRSLPYGRNSDRSDWGLVLNEGRGMCFTKHALLAELARENGRRGALVLGVYEMDGINTPGVGAVLKHEGLRRVPEAHCYLVHGGARVDLTRQGGEGQIQRFLYEEEIEPRQIGEYKVEAHKKFVRRWAEERGLDPGHVWRAREECIAALAGHAQFDRRPSGDGTYPVSPASREAGL